MGRDSPTPTSTPVDTPSLASQGRPATVCEGDPVDVGIYAIDDPAFAADWSGVEIGERYGEAGRLTDETVVVGVRRGDAARAYPVRVLWRHEIVNDALGGPLLVTYCSLCRSGIAERIVAGEPATFGVSGQLWQPPELQTRASEQQNRTFAVEPGDADPEEVRNTGNLVMFDAETGSYWSQLLARAICGPRSGDELAIAPSSTTTWGEWRAEHPDTDALLPPPHSGLMEVPFGSLEAPEE